jgi:HEAT repeat protein
VGFRLFYILLIFLVLLSGGCGSSFEGVVLGHTGGLGSRAMEILEEGLSDPEAQMRVNSIEVVASTGQRRLMPKVEKLLEDDFMPVRFAAALAVGDLEYTLAADSVRELLDDSDENIQIAAAYALEELGYGDGFAKVSKAVTSDDPVVCANAALLLGKMGDERGLKPLYGLLKDEKSDDRVLFQVVESIARLGDEGIYPRIWAMLISVYADDRVMGVRSMGALGTTDSKNDLIRMLDDDILEVRLVSAEQLGKLGYVTGEPEVGDVFTKHLYRDYDERGRERVMVLTGLAIGEICSESLTQYLPVLLGDKSKLVRLAASKAVLKCRN